MSTQTDYLSVMLFVCSVCKYQNDHIKSSLMHDLKRRKKKQENIKLKVIMRRTDKRTLKVYGSNKLSTFGKIFNLPTNQFSLINVLSMLQWKEKKEIMRLSKSSPSYDAQKKLKSCHILSLNSNNQMK